MEAGTLHVVHAPLVTFQTTTLVLVLSLEKLLLEPIPSIYGWELDELLSRHTAVESLTNTVPPVARLDTKPVRRRRRACVFRFARSLGFLLLYKDMIH